MHTVRGNGVASIKRCRRDLSGDGVRNLATVSGRGRLKEDLESSTWRRFHICVNSLATRNECCEMQQSFIHEYNENLVLKVELAKKEHMVEKKVFDEVEFFKINEWQVKLNAKDVSIANLRKHIENLKGKNMVEKAAPPNNAKVIDPGMFKLD
ncbi:hypothetical protein Tco_0433299 [Tanacetum coccineum]